MATAAVVRNTATARQAAAALDVSPAATENNFFKMLLAQLTNQDPTNPMTNADLTSQIAQINMVEGIQNLEQTVKNLSAAVLAGQSLQASALIGRLGAIPGDNISLANQVARGALFLPDTVEGLIVEIKTKPGQLVRMLDLGAQSAGFIDFTWDGKDEVGADQPDGDYRFSVVNATNGGQDVSASIIPESIGRIESVILAGSSAVGVQLQIAGNGRVPLSSLAQIL